MKKILSKPITILGIIILIGGLLRFLNLNNVPAGLHPDEASQGYNAFSLLKTGVDSYGQKLPILFRANGSYQPPLYTYLSVIPVYLFGNNAFSIRFVSALSGTILILLTYIIVKLWLKKEEKRGDFIALFSAAAVAVSPWAVHFSRIAVEANLGITIFAAGILFFTLSLKKISYLPFAAFFLGLSTHAYYTERVLSLLFLITFGLIFKDLLLKNIKTTITAAFVFAVTLIPHLLIFQTPAFTQRLSQVASSGSLITLILEFIKHYLSYFSPSNLFFNTTDPIARSAPTLGVFYNLFIIPFLFGIKFIIKNRNEYLRKIFLPLVILSPIPAAFTGNPFYPLRTLAHLWFMAIIISFGLFEIWKKIVKSRWLIGLWVILTVYLLFDLFISYFILFKYEDAAANYGYEISQLATVITRYQDKKIWLDRSQRNLGAGVQLAYYLETNPTEIQKQLSQNLTGGYYGAVFNCSAPMVIGNITAKPINWGEVCGKDLLLIGDLSSVGPDQMKAHELNLEFSISDKMGRPSLFAYSTRESCKE